MIPWAVTVGHHPSVLAAVEVDGGNPSVRWLKEREPARPSDPLSRPAGVSKIRLFRVARHDIRHEGRRDRWNIKPTRLGIECCALPVRTTHRAGQLDRSFFVFGSATANRRRSKQGPRHILL